MDINKLRVNSFKYIINNRSSSKYDILDSLDDLKSNWEGLGTLQIDIHEEVSSVIDENIWVGTYNINRDIKIFLEWIRDNLCDDAVLYNVIGIEVDFENHTSQFEVTKWICSTEDVNLDYRDDIWTLKYYNNGRILAEGRDYGKMLKEASYKVLKKHKGLKTSDIEVQVEERSKLKTTTIESTASDGIVDSINIKNLRTSIWTVSVYDDGLMNSYLITAIVKGNDIDSMVLNTTLPGKDVIPVAFKVTLNDDELRLNSTSSKDVLRFKITKIIEEK